VRDTGGDLLGYGYYNAATTIAIRMLSFGSALKPGDIIQHRLRNAVNLRSRVVKGDTNCYRLVNGDGDGLSGIVVDRYGDILVVQLLTAGAERMRAEIVTALQGLLIPRAIIERSAGAVRRQEGLDDRTAVLAGEPVAEAVVTENGIKLIVDFEHGQKTGFFIDQRANRIIVRELAQDARVLDAYCYTGGFTLAALAGGARHVVAVDTSAHALALARRNLEPNGHAPDTVEFIHGEAAQYLADGVRRFDIVVLDPPPLARSLKDVAHAARLYTELNAIAMRAVAPGGYLMTFSCSVHFRGDDFVRAVRIAQGKAGRNMRVIGHPGAGPDHPVLLGHAEGEYLRGLLLVDLG
jgi:23S rRNA (cytosine1962-C5)-methyltransferase